MEWIVLSLEKETYSENGKKNSAIDDYIKKMSQLNCSIL